MIKIIEVKQQLQLTRSPVRMSDVEAQVGAILEIMVNATVAEMTKVIGGPTRPEVSSCAAENTVGSPEEKVR